MASWTPQSSSSIDLKVVLLGMSSVGKSSLVDRLLRGKFDGAARNTIGAAFGAKQMQLPDGKGGTKGFTLGIWDTAGAERFESLSRVYYHQAGAAIVCFDPTDAMSWEKVKFWVRGLTENEQSCKIYLVETKHDILMTGEAERVVLSQEVDAYASEIHAPVLHTSAKTGLNVSELFQRIAEEGAAARPVRGRGSAQSSILDLSGSGSAARSMCC